jgi:hypothetical protein
VWHARGDADARFCRRQEALVEKWGVEAPQVPTNVAAVKSDWSPLISEETPLLR